MVRAISAKLIHSKTLESVLVGLSSQGFMMISGVLAARMLGVEGRGLLAILMLVPTLVSYVGSLGLPGAIVFYSRGRRLLSTQIFRSIRSYFVILLILLPIIHISSMLAFSAWRMPDLFTLAIWGLPVTAGILAQQFGLSLLQASGRYRAFSIHRLLHLIFYACLLLLVFSLELRNLLYVYVAWVLANSSAGLVTLSYAVLSQGLVSYGQTSDSHDPPDKRDVLIFGVKGLVGSVSPFESFRIDQLFIASFLSSYVLGLYVVAQSFAGVFRLVGRSIGMIAYPMASLANNIEHGKAQLIKYFLISCGTSILMSAPLIMLMPWLISILFGQEFSPSAPVAQILTLSGMLYMIRVVVGDTFRGLGYPWASTHAELAIYPAFILGFYQIMNDPSASGVALLVLLVQVVALAVIGAKAIVYLRKS
jgi:O-antigen/teichoic acid export membrane protein